LVSEKFSQLKVKIYRLPIVSSKNISRIAVVLSQKFQELEDTTDSKNQFIRGPRQDCVTCDNQQEPISAREFENIVIEKDD